MRRLEAAADGSNLTYTLFKVVKLVLVGQTERGKTSFAKAAYQISRGKEGGADWNPGGEEGKSGPELTFTFHWKFDHGNTAGYIPVYLIDTPGVGMAEGIDQANLKLAKENLTALVNIHGFVFVTDYTHHIIDADALVSTIYLLIADPEVSEQVLSDRPHFPLYPRPR